ncbi:glycosyltransferase family 2 protein [Agromyces aurantiacus]|uniref:Glycosyltransferase family 2 protein n=1 Tax=Agromyces aurantiacus TaxID=165814 RepID=A0ABV9R2M0_9MICO|nr:glycosyltransferase [Agromyces aurantiacus]MBM7502748.1 GT2 family glycosyltransferase [Agromyces aurantiacus]
MGDAPKLSVCIVTYERPEFLRRCLRSLADGLDAGSEIVVVDASTADRRGIADEAGRPVVYVHAPQLAGWMTRSRNEALRHVHGEIVSFLDDDVVLRPGWESALLAAFDDPIVAAVSGRTCNGAAGEEQYAKPIGRLLGDGSLTDGFASLPAGPVEVDHGIGANMSFRRSVLAELGGFRDDYPGTALREDTDIFLRIRAIGGRAIFAPDAAVDHLPAPHVRGARFDTRYKLYGRRNHMVLLARDGGIRSPLLRRWVGGQFRAIGRAGGFAARVRRFGVTLVGVAWGYAAVLRSARWHPLPPRRDDALGRELRGLLGAPAEGVAS